MLFDCIFTVELHQFSMGRCKIVMQQFGEIMQVCVNIVSLVLAILIVFADIFIEIILSLDLA